MTEHWRVGRSLGRTLYVHHDGDEDGQVIGMVDTPELAERICEAVNAYNAASEALERSGFVERVREGLIRLDGSTKAAVALLTGLTPEEIDELGGVDEAEAEGTP